MDQSKIGNVRAMYVPFLTGRSRKYIQPAKIKRIPNFDKLLLRGESIPSDHIHILTATLVIFNKLNFNNAVKRSYNKSEKGITALSLKKKWNEKNDFNLSYFLCLYFHRSYGDYISFHLAV